MLAGGGAGEEGRASDVGGDAVVVGRAADVVGRAADVEGGAADVGGGAAVVVGDADPGGVMVHKEPSLPLQLALKPGKLIIESL